MSDIVIDGVYKRTSNKDLSNGEYFQHMQLIDVESSYNGLCLSGVISEPNKLRDWSLRYFKSENNTYEYIADPLCLKCGKCRPTMSYKVVKRGSKVLKGVYYDFGLTCWSCNED